MNLPLKIEDIPVPPPGSEKTGWPWTESPAAVIQPHKVYPRISIVVPSYNQGQYIEETIRSILLQGYPDLELLIIDGGSRDQTVEVIKKYQAWITYWVSEKDRGQSDAINKGFARCTGEIVNWICSDDTLYPGALLKIAEAFSIAPAPDVVVGTCSFEFPDRPKFISGASEKEIRNMAAYNPIPQSSCFFRRSLLDRDPPLKVDLYYLLDSELWCYFLTKNARFLCVPDTYSRAFQDGTNKSREISYKQYIERDRIYRRYSDRSTPPRLPAWYRWFMRPLVIGLDASHSAMMRKCCQMGIQAIAWGYKLYAHRKASRSTAGGP